MSLSYTIADFSGGITDNVKVGNPLQAEKLNNYLVNDENGLTKRDGSVIFSDTVYRILSAEPLRHMFQEQGEYFLCSNRNIYKVTTAPAQVAMAGPTLNQPFNVGATTSLFSHTLWQNHVLVASSSYAYPIKMFKDATATWQLRTAGLPRIDVSLTTLTPSAGAGANTYIYAFCWFYTYNVGTVVYEDFGGVEYLTASSNGDVGTGGRTMGIALLPALTNAGGLNYDIDAVTGVKIKIYRTESTGTAMYLIGTVNNGTAVFTDNVADTALINNLPLYAQGGVVDNDAPPLCKYLMVVEGTGYYCNIKEGSEEKGFRVRLSKTGDVDSCPEDFYKDFDDDITGCSYIRNIPIIFARGKMWRLSGTFDDSGNGSVQATMISSTIGTVSHNSIIQTDGGLLFASEQGFAFTNGYQAFIISESFPKTYSRLVSTIDRASGIYGTYDKVRGLIYWACRWDDTKAQNDALFVLHEKKGIKKESCFTTWSNGYDFQPTSILINEDGYLIRGDVRGFIFKHGSLYRSDVKVDLGNPIPSTWGKTHIPYEYISTELFSNNKELKKLGGSVMVRSKNISDLSLLVSSANNGYKNFSTMPEIKRRDGIIWGGAYIPWGTPGFEWENTEDIEELRPFPAGGQMRFYTKQVKITPSWTEIEKSDDRCTATVNALVTPMRVTLDTPLTYDWCADCVDYWIYFEDDDYTQGYMITIREDGDNIRIATPIAPPTAGSKKWRIMGYPKNELFKLVSYTIYTSIIGNQFKPYNTADSGGNA